MPKNTKRKRFHRNRTLALSERDIEHQVIQLLEKADKIIQSDIDLAQNYANQAKGIQMKTRARFPSQWKKRFCKHCKSFLYPGINCRVRLSSSNKRLVIKCFHCNQYSRIPYNNKEGNSERINR